VDLATIKTGIEAWLAVTALNIDDAKSALPVEFARSPKKIHTKPFVKLRLGPIGTNGYDFPRYAYNDLTDEYVEQMRGVRRLPLHVQFIAFSQEWGKNARQFAEDFRARLKKQASMEALGDALLALQSTSDLIDTDYEMSGRLVSQVDMTVFLGLCGYERSPTDDVGYIRHVNMEAESPVFDEYGVQVYDQDGNPVVEEDTTTISVTADEAP